MTGFPYHTKSISKEIFFQKVMSGVQLELEAQEKNLVNLTETVQQKDKQILGLESQIKTALSENEKLRKTLYESDMDRELRLARLGKS